MHDVPLVNDFLSSGPGVLLTLFVVSGYPLYAIGIFFVVALLFRRLSVVYGLCVLAPLVLFAVGLTRGFANEMEGIFWWAVVCLFTLVGGVIGTLIATPFRISARDRGITYYY